MLIIKIVEVHDKRKEVHFSIRREVYYLERKVPLFREKRYVSKKEELPLEIRKSYTLKDRECLW